jgi:glycosyltransferase involved in cell wall biosynthesis
MPDFLVFAALVPKLLGARVILDIHDTAPEAYATKFNLPLEHPLIWLVKMEEVISAAFADQVITTQELHASTINQHGVGENKITIIMNLADTRIFHPSTNEHKHSGLTLVYHGTIAHRLGIDLILHAIKLARRDCPDLRFILYGHGEYAPAVSRIILESDLGDIVEMSGSVPVTELPAILSRADLGVIGNRLVTESRHNWMLPVKMMEYAAMDIPTIAPRLRVIQHYFDDTNTLFYRPDDPEDLARCIRLVYQNPDVLDRLRVGLRTFNTRYTWSEMAQRYLRLVRQPAMPDSVR